MIICNYNFSLLCLDSFLILTFSSKILKVYLKEYDYITKFGKYYEGAKTKIQDKKKRKHI